jgi:hypothetical protein
MTVWATTALVALDQCATQHLFDRRQVAHQSAAAFAQGRSGVAGCEDPRIDGVRRNGDEISTAVGSMLFAGKEKRGGMGEPVLRSLEFHPCGGLRVVKRYTSGRSAEYCQN